jgi:thiol-disulfide isomerase/thioredoxin
MNRTSTNWALGLIILCGTTAVADEGLFRDVSLDQAREAATKEGKRLILIDFYTVWCEPCKKLDQTTWKDEEVRVWLTQEAVCLKVDAEKNEALAETYRVNAYPTVMLLRPDGTEIDHLVGYRDAKTFLADAREALAGNDTLSRARKKLDGPERHNPMVRMSYGDALAQSGRFEDALSEYLWCFDHGLEHNRAFTGVRVSFLLSRIDQLARKHPQARDALRKRRDEARGAIEGGRGDFNAAMDFTNLNRTLGEPEQTLALYDRIKKDDIQPAQIRTYLLDQSLDRLLLAKRYKEVVAIGPDAKVNAVLKRYEQSRASRPKDERLHEFMKRQVSLEGAKYYEALVGEGDRPGAAKLASLLTEFDPTNAYPALIAAAKRAGDAETAESLAEEARKASKPSPSTK